MRHSINFFLYRKDSELIQNFLDQEHYGEYSSQYPVEHEDGFDTLYSLYSEDIEDAERIAVNYSDKLSKMLTNDYDIIVYSFEDKDWQEEWKNYYEPLHFGTGLSILPAWKEIDTDTNENIVKIDPGMAFGTGSHGSTYGCLVLLEKYLDKGLNVLDFGCGSAILAIAAAKLGSFSVDAIEIDHEACKNALENIRVNKSVGVVNVLCGSTDAIPEKKYDFIIANITADVIKDIYDELIAGQTKCHNILFSGISDMRKDDFEQFLKIKNLEIIEQYSKDGWNTYLTNSTSLSDN